MKENYIYTDGLLGELMCLKKARELLYTLYYNIALDNEIMNKVPDYIKRDLELYFGEDDSE